MASRDQYSIYILFYIISSASCLYNCLFQFVLKAGTRSVSVSSELSLCFPEGWGYTCAQFGWVEMEVVGRRGGCGGGVTPSWVFLSLCSSRCSSRQEGGGWAASRALTLPYHDAIYMSITESERQNMKMRISATRNDLSWWTDGIQGAVLSLNYNRGV